MLFNDTMVSSIRQQTMQQWDFDSQQVKDNAPAAAAKEATHSTMLSIL